MYEKKRREEVFSRYFTGTKVCRGRLPFSIPSTPAPPRGCAAELLFSHNKRNAELKIHIHEMIIEILYRYILILITKRMWCTYIFQQVFMSLICNVGTTYAYILMYESKLIPGVPLKILETCNSVTKGIYAFWVRRLVYYILG